MTVSRYI